MPETYILYLLTQNLPLALLYQIMLVSVVALEVFYTYAWTEKVRTTANNGRPEKEPAWLIFSSLSTALAVIVCFFWRLATDVGDSGYESTTGMPGADWCAAFTVLCVSQCILSTSLAQLWWRMIADMFLTRATGTLAAIWAALQLAANALTLCGAIPTPAASWWIPMLLGASALQEVLIAVSCLLLVYTTSFKESRRVYLHFFSFISAGCLVGIALSLAMIICRLKSANRAWDVLSMIAPLYRVAFLLAHLTYQRSVLKNNIGRNNADIMTLIDMQLDTLGPAGDALSSQTSSTRLSPGTLPATEDVDSEAESRMCRRREDEDTRTASPTPATYQSQDQVILESNII